MPMRRPPIPPALLLVAAAMLTQPGCMTALTSASLREAMLEAVDSLAEASSRAAPSDADVSARLVSDQSAPDDVAEPTPVLSLDEAVDRAVARLKAAGQMDAATQATLLATLESTNPEDWPAAIDAFTASLERQPPARLAAAPAATPQPPAPAAPAADDAKPPQLEELVLPAAYTAPALREPAAPPAEPARIAIVEAARPVAEEPLEFPPLVQAAPVRGPQPTEPPAPSPAGFTATELLVIEPERPAAVPGDHVRVDAAALEPGGLEPAAFEPGAVDSAPAPVDPVPVPAAPPATLVSVQAPLPIEPALAVRNACFASRVRAWGVVDRFPEAVFRPGQDVIVYFELDAPAVRPSATGHATSVDTLFRLVTADGRQIAQWDFEPIDETCHAPRRDYFLRYILRIPDSAPVGPCRLEFMVTDLVAGIATPARLDLEVR